MALPRRERMAFRARIVVEKPIGYDLESAPALNAILAANFEES